jgi:hypothetical protein
LEGEADNGHEVFTEISARALADTTTR